MLLAVSILLLGGCARESRRSSSADIQIGLSAVPFPPVVGETRLVVHVTDKAGRPINDASLAIKADMTHAGMTPVLAEKAGEGENGYYNVPSTWSMAGDWVVTVEAALADGSRAQQRFEFTVLTQDEAVCTDEDAEK
jgi:hypothetical protein